MALLKNICESCSVLISMIVNMSLEQGIVPDGMKLAKVSPVYTVRQNPGTLLLITDLSRCSPISQKYWRKWCIRDCMAL